MFDSKIAISCDTQQVVEAAAILNVSEFRLFELAYQDWYGVNARDNKLDAVYIPYIMCGQIPHWLRHFVRKTLLLCEEAGLFLPHSNKPRREVTQVKTMQTHGVYLCLIGVCLLLTML